MAIHHNKPHIWTADELALLTEVTERSWAHIERVRAEQVAFESVERFQLATQVAMIGTWDFYPTTCDFRWDERCKALFGLPRDPASDLSWIHHSLLVRADNDDGASAICFGDNGLHLRRHLV